MSHPFEIKVESLVIDEAKTQLPVGLKYLQPARYRRTAGISASVSCRQTWSQYTQNSEQSYMAIPVFHQSHIGPHIPKINSRVHLQWQECRFEQFSITASAVKFLFLKGWWQILKTLKYTIFQKFAIKIKLSLIHDKVYTKPPSKAAEHELLEGQQT